MKRPLRSLAVSGLATAAIFVGIEGALRLLDYPPPFVGVGLPVTVPRGPLARWFDRVLYDPEVLFRLRPGAEFVGGYRINSLGLVGPEVAPTPPPATMRILCLGDSCTFGISAGPGNAYPDLLAEVFRKAFAGPRVEVLNAGVPTYTSTQSLRQFRREATRLQPQMIVAYLGSHNDYQAAPAPVSEVTAGLRSPVGRILRTWNTWRALRHLLFRAGPIPPSRLGTVHTPLPEFLANLGELAADCARRGLPLLLVVPPHSPAKRDAQPVSAEYAQAVRDLARARAVPVVDPAPLFESLEPYPVWGDPAHPNRTGQRLLASLLYEALISLPEFEAPFRRIGPAGPALRAFESLAARSEEEEPTEAQWRDIGTRLEEAGAEDEAVGRALALVRLRGSDGTGEALLSEPSGEDPLLEGLAAFARGDERAARERFEEGRAAHPYRPGVAAFLDRLREVGTPGGAGTASTPRPDRLASVVREEALATDPFDRYLRNCPSLDEVRGSPGRAGAALLLLLHRDRILDGPPTLDRRVGRGLASKERGDLETARSLWLAALETNPAEVTALVELAYLDYAAGRAEEAKERMERAVRSDRECIEGWFSLAQLALQRGDARGALSSLDAGLGARPWNLAALCLRARIRTSLGDRAGARADLDRALEVAPEDPEVERLLRELGE